MGKKTQKKGGKAPKRPPPRAPSPTSSSEDEGDLAELRALIAKHDARQKLKRARKEGRGDGGGTSDADPSPRHSV